MRLDKKILLSTLWIFLVFNYLYCDVLTLMDPKVLNGIITGTIGGIQLTQGFLLGASILMEIPIMMVLLSRVLTYKANKIMNIITASIMAIVQTLSLFVGSPTVYYSFFSAIEITTNLFIIGIAWKWKGLRH